MCSLAIVGSGDTGKFLLQALGAQRTSNRGATLTKCYLRSSRVSGGILCVAHRTVELSNSATIHVPLLKGDHPMKNTTNTKRLYRRPAAFGLTNNPEESTSDTNDMYHFFGNYVARSEGVQRISKTLKENKGWLYVKNVHC